MHRMDSSSLLKLSLLIFCISLFGCGSDKDDSESVTSEKMVKIFQVGDSEQAKPREYPGTVKANKSVDLGFQVSGQVIEFPVTRGQEIKAGDMVARLDDRDYKNQWAMAKAELDNVSLQKKRSQELLETKTISQSKFDDIVAAYNIAQAKFAIAQKALDDTQLFAPYQGRVAEKFIDNFENIQAKQPVISLQAIETVDIEVNIPEQDMIFAKESKDIEHKKNDVVVFSALPGREFSVKLKEYSTQADPKTQTYRVLLTMQAPTDVNILPGMSATFILRTQFRELDQQFTIPSQCVAIDSQGRYYVWVVDSSTVRKREVEVGALTDDRIEIKSGLNPGDTIVAAGVHLLSEGMNVRWK